jgi:hypothetical protein
MELRSANRGIGFSVFGIGTAAVICGLAFENLGHPGFHYANGIGWASACGGPLDLFKMTVGEGGIRDAEDADDTW